MFFRKYDVSEGVSDWLVESFNWAIDKGILTHETPLIAPTKAFFSAPSGRSPEVVMALVENIKTLLSIQDAQISVLPIDQMAAEYRHSYNATSETSGTWQSDGNHALIRYNADLIASPIAFIGMLAHEVMHHVLHRFEDRPPGGIEAEELSTDLHCITTGFGIFQMAGAEVQGWQGYLRQPTRAHALALFLAIREISADAALSYLPPRSAKMLRRALQEVNKSPDVIAALDSKLRYSH